VIISNELEVAVWLNDDLITVVYQIVTIVMMVHDSNHSSDNHCSSDSDDSFSRSSNNDVSFSSSCSDSDYNHLIKIYKEISLDFVTLYFMTVTFITVLYVQ